MWTRVCLVLVLAAGVADATPAFVGGMRREEPMPSGFHQHRGIDTQPQLQPANYDNSEHGVPNFFEHELIYVENNLVLVWKPVTGQWRLHKVMRSCGPECPIISERPIKKGEWPDLKFRKLVFLGCHDNTGFGHMLVLDPAASNYTVMFFDDSAEDPMTTVAARHQRLEASEFKITYMGRDEIVMFDGNTNQYRVYLVQPNLPLAHDEDPIAPFQPLDEGTFDLHEQLVYVGHNHVLDYSAVTGEYTLYLYDRGATVHETPFGHVLAQGKIETYFQLTYVGEHQVIALNPHTGYFKAFNIYEEGKFIDPEEEYYGFGTVVLADMCKTQGTCRTCISRDGCGWCSTNQQCYRGGVDGPCSTNCTSFELHLCPGEPCHTHRACSECLSDPFCGWCADSSLCTEGSHAGPLFGECDFSKVECPVYVPVNEREIAPCVGKIE